MPTEFKKGKWNPNVELVEMDYSKADPTSNIFLECCIRCNNRNVHRAAATGNFKLLQRAIEAKKKISLLTAFWGPDVSETAIDIMIKNNQHEMLEALMHPKLTVPQHSTYQRERDITYSSRIANP